MDEQSSRSASSAERPVETMAGRVLDFSLSSEIEKLKSEQEWDTNGRNSKTLVKHPDFRIVLTILKRDTRLKEHRTAGRISLQPLSGRIRVHLQEVTYNIGAGQLLALDRSVAHDVEALEDSAFLITIAWPGKE
jgi:quercetin dioxygenase-like cupin family protein